ncbi:hypothetical protein AB6A40_007807 [Gnathostoma spinigerum]|uniref:Uncharacterized protein n=1 Tax=Gnathostoma spinigerum TaxID=75299 RepID=A0ABD6EMB7_9BILA
MPWWIMTQHMSPTGITNMIENAYALSKTMLNGLSSFQRIEILGIDNPAEFTSGIAHGHYSPPVVLVFKYKYPPTDRHEKSRGNDRKSEERRETATSSPEGPVNIETDATNHSSNVFTDSVAYSIEYANSLNAWLGQGLISDCRTLGIQLIELGGMRGNAFRFCPLEVSASYGTRIAHVQDFLKQLTDAIAVLDSTVSAHDGFHELQSQYPSLFLLPVERWAGVGGACYIPSIVKGTPPSEWNDKQKQQVSYLNVELVHSLRSVDSAFSSGESSVYGVSCVKFGMLSNEKDIIDLLNLVAERGKEIEDSQQYLDSLAAMIRQGIETVNEDLKRENEARLMHEGIMRQIPIMSSFVNWISPLNKEVQNIKGRSFDLKTGQIQPSEVFYKVKDMELNMASKEPHQSFKPNDQRAKGDETRRFEAITTVDSSMTNKKGPLYINETGSE